MVATHNERSGFSEAAEWIGKISTIGMEMALCSIGGSWLAKRYDLPWLAPLCVGLGVLLGIYHLLIMTDVIGASKDTRQDGPSEATRKEPTPPVSPRETKHRD